MNPTPLKPNQIPLTQAERVRIFEQWFGPFSNTYNAYWSLRMGRKVTIPEGATFDAQMAAGKLAPAVRVASQLDLSWTGKGAPAPPVPAPQAPAMTIVSPVGSLPILIAPPRPVAAVPTPSAAPKQAPPAPPAPVSSTVGTPRPPVPSPVAARGAAGPAATEAPGPQRSPLLLLAAAAAVWFFFFRG